MYSYCSCWYFPMEGQESYRGCARTGNCNLGTFRVAWVPPSHASLPYLDSWFGNHFLVVQCINLHQQVWSFYTCYILLNISHFTCYMCLTFLCTLLRSPPKIPEVVIPQDIVLGVTSALRIEINTALALLRDVASGRDLKKFLAVCIWFCGINLLLVNQ